MSTKNGIFAGKLCELERQYEQTIRCLRCCQRSDHWEIQRALRCLWQEYRENDLLLQRSIAKSHSPAVAALSPPPRGYDRKNKGIIQKLLPGDLHGGDSDMTEDQAEAASLYGEYAIDFAAQAMRHALLAALSAIDLQMNCEERENIPENTEETSK